MLRAQSLCHLFFVHILLLFLILGGRLFVVALLRLSVAEYAR